MNITGNLIAGTVYVIRIKNNLNRIRFILISDKLVGSGYFISIIQSLSPFADHLVRNCNAFRIRIGINRAGRWLLFEFKINSYASLKSICFRIISSADLITILRLDYARYCYTRQSLLLGSVCAFLELFRFVWISP